MTHYSYTMNVNTSYEKGIAKSRSNAVRIHPAIVAGPLSLLAPLAGLFLVATPTSAQLAIEPIALSGGNTPQTTTGSFAEFELPLLNESGVVAFLADLERGGEVQPLAGVFSGQSSSTLRAVATAGDPADTGDEGAAFQYFTRLTLNNVGNTAFRGNLIGAGITPLNDLAIFVETGEAGGASQLRVAAQEREPAPGGPGLRFGYEGALGSPMLNDLGQVAFIGFLEGSSFEDESIFSEAGSPTGELRLVARELNTMPDNRPDVGLRQGFSRDPQINNAGQTAFFTQITGNGSDSIGMFLDERNDAGEHTLTLLGGNRSGGSGRHILMNEAGQIIVYNNANMFTSVDTPGGRIFEPVSDKGDSPIGHDEFFFANFGRPMLNEAGQIAYGVAVQGPDAIVFHEAGQLRGQAQLVVRAGTPAPGTPSGSSFGDFYTVLLNDHGHMVFGSRVFEPLLGRNHSLFVTLDQGTNIRRLLGWGDEIDVDPNPSIEDLRTISAFSYDFDGKGYNNAGHLALRLEFTDGTSGIFVVNTLVPEPALGLVTVCWLLAISRARLLPAMNPELRGFVR